jgi:outer membrane protein
MTRPMPLNSEADLRVRAGAPGPAPGRRGRRPQDSPEAHSPTCRFARCGAKAPRGINPAPQGFGFPPAPIILAAVLCASAAFAQQTSIAPTAPRAPAILRPYLAPEVPPVREANSPRLSELVRAGTLYLTVQDAIALALENNIDIEVARYNPLILSWNVTRSEAGGALPGVPSSASQAGSVASGQGVAGSLQAAGQSILGTGAARAGSTNATISQIGPITPTLDPIVQETSTFSHITTVYPDAQVSISPAVVDVTRTSTASIQQGILTGGTVNLTYSDHYLNENSPSDTLNPTSAPALSLSVSQYLLNSAGIAVNARFINVAKMNRDASDLAFQTTVTNTVSQVLNAYYSLEAAYEDVKAKRNAAETATTFLANVREQVRIGSLAPSETINAESLAITAQQALVDAETTVQQQEIQLKNLLSRNGTADPVLAGARILPVDPIRIPEHDDFPPLEDLVKQALTNRTDLASERENEAAKVVSNLGTKNGILPFAEVLGSESQAGLAGTERTVFFNGTPVTSFPVFKGGIGTALGQVFRRDFPSENITAGYEMAVRNRQAQSDYAIDQLTLRQTQLSNRIAKYEPVIGLEVHVQLGHRDQDLLRLPHQLRRAAQQQRLPGLPGPAGRAAGAEAARPSSWHERRPWR